MTKNLLSTVLFLVPKCAVEIVPELPRPKHGQLQENLLNFPLIRKVRIKNSVGNYNTVICDTFRDNIT